MRLDAPRIPALDESEWDDEARALLEPLSRDGDPLNIFKTLANHPDLMRRWMVFATHVLGKSSLPARERELVILRIGWLCRAGYEWGQHVLIGRDCGLEDDEIRAIGVGPDAPSWSPVDAALLRATDELHADAHVSDATWATLSEHFDQRQLMDLVFTIGQYNLVSMALNSFGVQADPDLPGFDV